MSPINLSYIIATRNRLSFLKITLEKLLSELQPDEEIVVVDGDSTDGAKEYLQDLFEKNKIHQFISEPDRNQAHGWNKAMLMARGRLIKKIIDDDVFCYKAIRKCKNYMLEHQDVDLCLSNSLGTALVNHTKIAVSSDLKHFENWKAGNISSFPFSDAHTLIRRNSLSYLGVYDTQFKMMDWEYSLRVTYLGAKIAFYTGHNVLSVYTPGNVSSTATKEELKTEGRIGKIKYSYNEGYEISLYSHCKIFIGKAIFKLFRTRVIRTKLPIFEEKDIPAIYAEYYKVIDTYFSDTSSFIC